MYKGSLISLITSYGDPWINFYPNITISGSTFKDNLFVGKEASLIYVKNALV